VALRWPVALVFSILVSITWTWMVMRHHGYVDMEWQPLHHLRWCGIDKMCTRDGLGYQGL
jgi:hypothetical protein